MPVVCAAWPSRGLSGMLSDSVQALAARKATLDAELAAARRELKTERQRQKDAKRRVWVLSEWLSSVVLILYSLAGHTSTVARLFLARAARKRKWPAKTEEQLNTIIEDKFLAVDVDHLTGLADLEAPTDPSAMKAAAKFYEEWRLVEWVKQMNVTKGVAPSTERVLARYEEVRTELPVACRPGHVGTAAASKARSWARRWRLRWGGRHGTLRARSDITAAEIRDKARIFSGPVVPESGPVSWTRIWSRFRDQNLVPYLAPRARLCCFV